MKTLTELNNGLNKITDILNVQTTNKNVGVKEALQVIATQLEEHKILGMSSRKSRKLVKAQIMDVLTGGVDKNIERAYTVAFGIGFRGLTIHTELLTIAQTENLVKHGEVKAVNALYSAATTDYEADIKAYLKGLKTRDMIVKTYEKKSK